MIIKLSFKSFFKLFLFFALLNTFGYSQDISAQSTADFKILKQYDLMEICHFKNPSFEEDKFSVGEDIISWNDCGLPKYTPPTVHVPNKSLFEVAHQAKDGDNFISMVARADESWELISQELDTVLLSENEYLFALNVAISHSMKSHTFNDNGLKERFDNPLVLKIYGGEDGCDKFDLLFKSDLIKKEDWEELEVRFKPKRNITWISIECYYKTPALMPYNGNLLLDHLSPIYQVIN